MVSRDFQRAILALSFTFTMLTSGLSYGPFASAQTLSLHADTTNRSNVKKQASRLVKKIKANSKKDRKIRSTNKSSGSLQALKRRTEKKWCVLGIGTSCKRTITVSFDMHVDGEQTVPYFGYAESTCKGFSIWGLCLGEKVDNVELGPGQ